MSRDPDRDDADFTSYAALFFAAVVILPLLLLLAFLGWLYLDRVRVPSRAPVAIDPAWHLRLQALEDE